jgi:predicted small secreted protein
MKKVRKCLFLFVLSAACVTAISGCRTAHGFGEDVEHAGQKMQENSQ